VNLSALKTTSVILAAAAIVVAGIVVLVQKDPLGVLVDDTRFSEEIAAAAKRHNVPPQLVRALIFQESRFDPRARGSKGEIGLMQVLPKGAVADWARYHKVSSPAESDLFDPVQNLEIGCWYLGNALRRWKEYKCAVELALAQYNAGGSRAKKWKPDTFDGDVLSRVTLPGTKQYIINITKRYRSYLK
jgi:soluble lytic murein transglycosylase